MSLTKKLVKFFYDPLGVISRRLTRISEWFRYKNGHDYKTVDYWKYRHGKYGFDLRGVGDKTKSHEENVKLLEEGTKIFLEVCKEAEISFNQVRLLDIGCGTGHFADVLRNNGVKDYLGIDIVDTLFQGLKDKFPGFRFQQLDISMQQLSETFDLIIAMDVLQHIVEEKKFNFALDNIKSHLSSSGKVIISVHYGPYHRDAFYCVQRPLEVYKNAFPEFTLSEPIKYADSYVFSIRRKS